MNPRHVEYLGCGRNRLVFAISSKYVLKVPRNEQGLDDNSREAWISAKLRREADTNGRLFARCRILPNGWLVMERVAPIIKLMDKPPWADFVDCGQVGRTSRGQVVAYDYGDQ